MTLKETPTQLEALRIEKMRKQNAKHGAGDNQFGVRLGEFKKLAKKMKTNHVILHAAWSRDWGAGHCLPAGNAR